MLGLYLHIPFCHAICSYCNFNRGLYDEALSTRYVAALEREILTAGTGEAVDTIFFGGGTPSLLDPTDVQRLVEACHRAYSVASDAEITLETNPETATRDRLRRFREAGINRLSFGAQTFDDAELKRLGRLHDARRVATAVAGARHAGFRNISLDLMFWLPGQSLGSWQQTVERALDLEPEHVSFYLLELYPNAPLREAMARASADGTHVTTGWAQAADDEAADMYLDALGRMDARGYVQYEISNAARRGYQSRHNLKYWTGGSWRGFGCGAHSTVNAERWQNVAGIAEYAERIERGLPVEVQRHRLDTRARLEEGLFTGLRLSAGIDRRAFEIRYGIDPWTLYSERLQDAVRAGVLWQNSDRFGLTRPGMLIANEILTALSSRRHRTGVSDMQGREYARVRRMGAHVPHGEGGIS